MVKQIITESPGQLGFEELARIGSFEINLFDRSWSASKNFCSMFGLKFPQKYDFQEFNFIIHPDFYKSTLKKLDECIKNGNDQSFETICYDALKKPVCMECRLRLIRDDHGIPSSVQGILQDISDRKDKEQQITALLKTNKTKDEVLTIVAHDLKSPINHIRGILNLIRMSQGFSKEYINYIEEACGIANNIITDLIEVAEMNETGYVLKKSLLDIDGLVKSTIEQHKLAAKEKNIAIHHSLCGEAMAIVHPLKMGRVLDNLMSNAIKFTLTGGDIRIMTETTTEKISIKVIDTGIGISPEKLPLIFDRFSSARQPGTTGEKSTGLGLSIVKKIVALHDGQVRVHSQVNKGSEFVVELPRAI